MSTPLPLQALAPAKVNIGLHVGPTRPDSRHELVTVMQSISLADRLTLEAAPHATRDEVVCPGVSGENLAARALSAFRRATGWDAPPVRLTIDKRIPLAAGLAGGSADAAATLRLALKASGLGGMDLSCVLAAQLGADVPAQVSPGRSLATGAGELLTVQPLPRDPLGVLVLPQAVGLSTADVYAAADRLSGAHDALSLRALRERLHEQLSDGQPLPREQELLVNDLQAAALELCPEIASALAQAAQFAPELASVSGSGPTVVGLFTGADGPERARQAAAALGSREPPALAAVTVDASFAAVRPLGE